MALVLNDVTDLVEYPTDIAIGPDGRRYIFASAGSGQVYEHTGMNPGVVTPYSHIFPDPESGVVSPDGQYLYVVDNTSSGGGGISRLDVDTGDVVPITTAVRPYSPTFGPDGNIWGGTYTDTLYKISPDPGVGILATYVAIDDSLIGGTWAGRSLYIGGGKNFFKFNLDTEAFTHLVDLSAALDEVYYLQCEGMCVINKRAYFTNRTGSTRPAIISCKLDGSDVVVELMAGEYELLGICPDRSNNRIFVAHPGFSDLEGRVYYADIPPLLGIPRLRMKQRDDILRAGGQTRNRPRSRQRSIRAGGKNRYT